MYKELERKVFILKNCHNKDNMEQHIKEYVKKLKILYPEAIVTREFYKEDGILVRATLVINSRKVTNTQLEIDEEVRIIERGINGIGENVNKQQERERSKTHSSGTERERC